MVMAAVAALAARVAGDPGWLVVSAAAVGGAALPVATSVQTQLEQQRKNRADVRRLTTGAAEPSRLVRDWSARDLRGAPGDQRRCPLRGA